MPFVNTYESHLVGVGLPMSSEKLTGTTLFTDEVRFLPFTQSVAYQYSKDIKRESYLGSDTMAFNRQMDWPDVAVDISQIDYFMQNESGGWSGYSGAMGDLNIFPRGTTPSIGEYYPIFKNLITGGRETEGSAIYFLSDTGERYRDQIQLAESSIVRQIAVIDPCYLNSISWGARAGGIALYNYSFAGNYVSVHNQTKGDSTVEWDKRSVGNSGIITSGSTEIDPVHEDLSYINIETISGIFIGSKITVSGAPDFGEIKGVNWSVQIPRVSAGGLGTPMIYDRKMEPSFMGSLTIDYNYEGQKIHEQYNTETPYEIYISCQNGSGDIKTFKIEDALLESVGLNTSVSGEPDSYSTQFSFVADKDGGILEQVDVFGAYTWDDDALAYFASAEGSGGSFDLTSINALYTEDYIKRAHNDLVIGLKTDGVWDKIGAMHLHMGVTFAGLIKAIKGPDMIQLLNYSSGDYVAAGASELGLKGNGFSMPSGKRYTFGSNPTFWAGRTRNQTSVFSWPTTFGTSFLENIFYRVVSGFSQAVYTRVLNSGTSFGYSSSSGYGEAVYSGGALNSFFFGQIEGINSVLYKNGASVVSVVSSSSAIDGDVTIYGNSSGYYTGQSRFCVNGYGEPMTATEISNFYARMNTFKSLIS